MRIKARAKINWTLDIVGKRADGYHMLDTLMQTVELYDTLIFEPNAEREFVLDGSIRMPVDEGNLVVRAMNLIASECGVHQGVRIILHKRIPIGGGMGGGSADAAATLAGLNRFWRLGLREEELRVLGLNIGADVPFCLTGGLARATGIGESIEKFPCPRPAYLIIIQPCRGHSTREIFQLFVQEQLRPSQRPNQEAAVRFARTGDIRRLCGAMGNALQATAVKISPEIAQAIQGLEAAGAIRAQMTGSGSAVFGVFDTAYGAQLAWEILSPIWRRCWSTRTASRSLVFRQWLG